MKWEWVLLESIENCSTQQKPTACTVIRWMSEMVWDLISSKYRNKPLNTKVHRTILSQVTGKGPRGSPAPDKPIHRRAINLYLQQPTNPSFLLYIICSSLIEKIILSKQICRTGIFAFLLSKEQICERIRCKHIWLRHLC